MARHKKTFTRTPETSRTKTQAIRAERGMLHARPKRIVKPKSESTIAKNRASLNTARHHRLGGNTNMTALKIDEVKMVAREVGIPLSSGGIALTKGELERRIILSGYGFPQNQIRKKYGGTYDAGQGRRTRFH